MCLSFACVRSCPSPSTVSRSKRMAFELLWKWSMLYGPSRCGLTWFGFNTSPQEVHKASRSVFCYVSHLSQRANGVFCLSFLLLTHLLLFHFLYTSDRAVQHMHRRVNSKRRCDLILTLCFVLLIYIQYFTIITVQQTLFGRMFMMRNTHTHTTHTHIHIHRQTKGNPGRQESDNHTFRVCFQNFKKSDTIIPHKDTTFNLFSRPHF